MFKVVKADLKLTFGETLDQSITTKSMGKATTLN